MKKVSIILPSYNYERFLAEAIESVLAQTYPYWELIIVDDGSSDSSQEIIQTYSQRYPEKVKAFFHENHQNRGMVETYRLGLRHCAGDYVAFIEADDVWKPENLESKVKILRDHPDVAVVHHKVQMVGDPSLVAEQKRKFSWRRFPTKETTDNAFYAFPCLMNFNFVLTFSSFITRRELLSNLDFSAKHAPWLDWWLLTQLSLRGKFFYSTRESVLWRVHQKNYNRQYSSGIDDYREGLKLQDQIFHFMKAHLLNEKKRNNNELLSHLDMAIKIEARKRIWMAVVQTLKAPIKKVLSQNNIEKIRRGRVSFLAWVRPCWVVGHVDGYRMVKDGQGTRCIFYGWLFISDKTPVSRIEIFYGQDCVGHVRYGGWREEVSLLYGGHQEVGQSGFDGWVPLPDKIWHTFSVVIVDKKERVFEAFRFDLRKKLPHPHRVGPRLRNRLSFFFSCQKKLQTNCPTKIIIMGLAKSATTALFFRLRESLWSQFPSRTMRSLNEPFNYDISQEKRYDFVVAKVLLYQGRNFLKFRKEKLQHRVDYERFNHFDKKIFIVRDPRDRVVSQLLFSTRGAPFRDEASKMGSLLDLLKKKEQHPGSISFLDLMTRAGQLEMEGWNSNGWREAFEHYFNFSLGFLERHPEFHVLKYEDFVDGKIGALQDYLDFHITKNTEIDFTHEIQGRTKSYGFWRNWFLPEDVDFFRPIFSKYIERYHYEDDWSLPARQVMPVVHGSGYVEKSLAEIREREKRVAR